MKKQIRLKLITGLISLFLVGILVYLFFLDRSLEWNGFKICSCIVSCIWIFFLMPSIVYFGYKIKNSDLEYSAKLGFYIGSRCFIGFIITPYYGMKMYLSDLNTICYGGEIIL